MNCTMCGAIIPTGQTNCPMCGAPVQAEQPADNAQPVQPQMGYQQPMGQPVQPQMGYQQPQQPMGGYYQPRSNNAAAFGAGINDCDEAVKSTCLKQIPMLCNTPVSCMCPWD